MHVNWGFWGALLGVSTLSSVYNDKMNDKMRRGDELAKTLILCTGNGDVEEARRILSQYRFDGTLAGALNSATAAAIEAQRLKDGTISSAPHLQRFREWCRTLV